MSIVRGTRRAVRLLPVTLALVLSLLAASALTARQTAAAGASSGAAPAGSSSAAAQPGGANAAESDPPATLDEARARLAKAQADLAQAQAQLAQAVAQAQAAQAQAQQAAQAAQAAQVQAQQAAAAAQAAVQAQQAGAAARAAAQPTPAQAAAAPGAAGSPGAAAPAAGQPASLAQAAAAGAANKATEPFAFADFTWLTGNSREKESLLDSKYFTGEFRLDSNYVYDFNHPKDHTIDGSAETGRADELQVQQLGIGGDFHWDNVRGRFMTQFGMYSEETPRDDASPARGQWNLADAYRYLSEAYGGYHWDVMHGVNLDAGIFMSYIGLFSYYNYDNWAYQPSYVSANTPWFFNGLRLQTFPTDKLKVELWLINGWQSYGMFNSTPGAGTQILWRPNGAFSFVTNDYWGRDTLGNPDRERWHSDNSIQVKYYDRPANVLDKSAFSLTVDAGCENGGGVTCAGGNKLHPSQYFLGFMFYDRLWFYHDKFGVTLGGGEIDNPGRYLVLLPPINGATAASGTPYFTTNPGDPFRAWDASFTFDWMPVDYITFRWEADRRVANVPYFVGPGGLTPPGGNTGAPGSLVANFNPDLRHSETRLNLALLVKF
jgi:hypothetical protein